MECVGIALYKWREFKEYIEKEDAPKAKKEWTLSMVSDIISDLEQIKKEQDETRN